MCFLFLAACGGKSAKSGTMPSPSETSATSSEPAAEPSRAPEQVLAVVPVTKGRYPKAALALDEAMQAASLPNMSRKVAGTPLDVAQLAIGCAELTPECHAGLAKSLEADQLLLGRITPGSARGEVRVEVVRTDASGATLGSASGTYKSDTEAAADSRTLVARALSGEKSNP
jgi:hypothetical protein